jgi:formamidopyrimidine-DNA glycosylase
MPELPDVTVYIEHLERRIVGATLEDVRVASPNLLRTAEPPLADTLGRRVLGVSRIGKRIAIHLEGGFHLVLHLMIAGRLHWKDAGDPKVSPPARPRRVDLAWFTFSTGVLSLTEASTKQRASLHVVGTEDDLRVLDPGGLEPIGSSLAAFRDALLQGNHTLKRALTDPRGLSGIGNAYSDEILHRAQLSPLRLTSQLSAEEVARLHEAVQAVLTSWTDRLRAHYAVSFPEKVTAFREGMAVHGRYRQPCPVCGAPIQRIVYGEHETNYCPRCQTGGRLLMDRSLSRLLKEDWPRTLEELEEQKERRAAGRSGRS